ncbi:hypothetical protein D3C75_567300 [compost metagenome]
MNPNNSRSEWYTKIASASFFWTLTGPIALSFAAGQFLFADVYDVLSLWSWFATPFIFAVILGMAGWALYLFMKARQERLQYIQVPSTALARERQISFYACFAVVCALSLWAGMVMQTRTNQFQRAAQVEARRLQAIDVSAAIAPLLLANCVGPAGATPDAADAPAVDQQP